LGLGLKLELVDHSKRFYSWKKNRRLGLGLFAVQSEDADALLYCRHLTEKEHCIWRLLNNLVYCSIDGQQVPMLLKLVQHALN